MKNLGAHWVQLVPISCSLARNAPLLSFAVFSHTDMKKCCVICERLWAGSWRKLACCCTVIEGAVLNNWVNVLPQHSPQYPNHVCELWTTLNCNWITWNGVHNYCNGRWIPLLSVLLFCSAHVWPMDGARRFVSRSVVKICVTVVGRCSRILANDQNEENITRGGGSSECKLTTLAFFPCFV